MVLFTLISGYKKQTVKEDKDRESNNNENSGLH